MLIQVGEDGYKLVLMEGIIGYKKYKTYVSKEDSYVVTKSGSNQPINTTVGWNILVQWKDKTGSWIHLKDTKESHPAEVAYFSKAKGVVYEPDLD